MSWQVHASSEAKGPHTCGGEGRKNCRRCRWFEVTIKGRQVVGEPTGATTRYRITIVGRSVIPGEVDRVSTESTSSASRVIEFLALGPVRDRYIPKVSRLALAEAGDYDPHLTKALRRFDQTESA